MTRLGLMVRSGGGGGGRSPKEVVRDGRTSITMDSALCGDGDNGSAMKLDVELKVLLGAIIGGKDVGLGAINLLALVAVGEIPITVSV